MTTITEENYGAGTSPDDFIGAGELPLDDPDDVSAGHDAEPDAPYGWTRDPDTGQMRPKKRPGRPGKPPAAEELAQKDPVTRAEDRRPKSRDQQPKTDADYPPMPRGGVIASGVNRLYRRAGKIVRAMDYDIGTAIIECTRKDEDDDLTVGEAWENLCKANPRIRAFILKVIAGGAWGELVMAHAPIMLAIAMKPAIMRLIPFRRLVESLAEPDDDSPDGDLGGLTAGDVDQAAGMAEQLAEQAVRKMGLNVSPEEMAEARRMAEQAMAGGGNIPPAFRRQQPKSKTRAQRNGAR